jgi:Trypsin-like peptidase domain
MRGIMLNKWKKAVIHIECATDSEHSYDKMERLRELIEKFKSEEISQDEFVKEQLLILGKLRDIRSWGTALFLIYNSKRYLVTARHVVWDEKSAERELEEEKNRTKSLPENRRRGLLQSAEEKKQNQIFSIIFRVPSRNEIISKDKKNIPSFLMNLGAGVTSDLPYTFSSKKIDLAIISLDREHPDSQFADELLELGYEPISLEDINDEPTGEGSEVFTVGFPGAISKIGTLNRQPAEVNWASNNYSLPAFAFGKVSMLNEELPCFWADMSIYKGNSGGPVIEDDKLVGVVSAQPKETSSAAVTIQSKKFGEISWNVPIPFARIVKAKYLFDLIEQQEQKDNFTSP